MCFINRLHCNLVICICFEYNILTFVEEEKEMHFILYLEMKIFLLYERNIIIKKRKLCLTYCKIVIHLLQNSILIHWRNECDGNNKTDTVRHSTGFNLSKIPVCLITCATFLDNMTARKGENTEALLLPWLYYIHTGKCDW